MIRLITVCAALCLAAAPLAALAEAPVGGWVGAWEASPQPQPTPPPLKPLKDQTVRQRARLAVGGRRVRVLFTNAYGSKPLTIDAASVGRMAGDAVEAGSIRPLTFGGQAALTLPPGAPALSDPVDLAVEPGGEVAISLHLPQETVPETYHRDLPAGDAAGPAAAPEAVVSPVGDFTRAASIPGATPTVRLFVARVDVMQPQAAGAVVVLGTTRTEGDGHWPEYLAQRLQKAGRRLSVVNASMVANPLTRPYSAGGGEAALTRFDRDVLDVPGATYVVIADAINDLGQVGTQRNGQYLVPPDAPMSVEWLQAAYRQLVARAHARGVKVIAATVMPFEGVPFGPGFYTPEKEAIRVALNQWIRTSGAFDGVIDLDAMVRDPTHPSRFTPGTATANNFGPNPAGERRIAETIDLKLFR